MRGDCARLADMLRVTQGVDAIVHLGGFSVEGPWETILRANIVGAYNVFEAARRNGVRRLVFASSNHAVGFYRRDQTIDHRVCAEARQPLRRVQGIRRGPGQPLRRQVRHGSRVPANRQRRAAAGGQAPPVDLALAARPRAARLDRHRPAGLELRDRLRRLRQRAQLVRQRQRRSAWATARRTTASSWRRRCWRRRSRAPTLAPKPSRAAPSSSPKTAATRRGRRCSRSGRQRNGRRSSVRSGPGGAPPSGSIAPALRYASM